MANTFIFEKPVVAGTDDAEERASGTMALHSTDLDFFDDHYGNGGDDQKVGIRFTNIKVPAGATITNAYVQFYTDETSDAPTSMLMRGEDSDNAAGFSDVINNISARPTTDASSTWTPESWSNKNETSPEQRTSDLSAIVQEIVARPGWQSGNDLALLFSGSGSRTAEAFDGVPGREPVLHIEWAPAAHPGGDDTTPPEIVMEGPKDGSQVSDVITLSAIASDNVGVESVQFLLDGDSVGSLDTSAPYTVALDTTRQADGTVALSAVAKDAAGNETTSAPVTVTIDNGSHEPPPPPPSAGTIRVPQDYATIQEAVNHAGNGDTILVGPGTYAGGIDIAGKSITLTSLYHVAGDSSLVDQTIIKGGSPGIHIDDSAPNTTIAGFHFVGGEKSVQFFGKGGQCLDNFFDHTGGDAISFENTGGVARGNLIIGAGDDGVDVDAASANILIEHNTIRLAGDDGIEIRNQNYHGPFVTETIRGNTIVGSDEDGIQLIDYSELSNRAFVVENNTIQGSKYVGLGIMDNGETREDFRGASMPERVEVSNNTFDGNRYGITGGDNLTATDNTISNSDVGVKNVDGGSTLTGTRFINNEVDSIHSNVVSAGTATTTLGLNDVLDVSDGTDMLVLNSSTVSGAAAGGSDGGGVVGLGVQTQIEQPATLELQASP